MYGSQGLAPSPSERGDRRGRERAASRAARQSPRIAAIMVSAWQEAPVVSSTAGQRSIG